MCISTNFQTTSQQGFIHKIDNFDLHTKTVVSKTHFHMEGLRNRSSVDLQLSMIQVSRKMAAQKKAEH